MEGIKKWNYRENVKGCKNYKKLGKIMEN